MPIVTSSPTGERGKKDARRHRDRQREVIRKKLPDIIADESIITKRKGKIIKIPIRGIVIPDFRSGSRRKGKGDKNQQQERRQGGVGIGQGSGKPGDIIDRRPGQGNQPGGAGEEPGQDYIETEIDIEELIEMMLEDLGLPKLEEKEIAELEVILGLQIEGIIKSGTPSLLSKKHTAKKSMGRFYSYLEILKTETGKDELLCFNALKEADGNLEVAFTLLEDPEFKVQLYEVEPFLIFHDDDLRYHNFEENIEHESNAVVMVLLDVSGSMSSMKKYLARSMMFWVVEFLRKLYTRVEVRFIIYHSEAKLVDEHTAFHTHESGGTKGYNAYELASSLIDSEYSTNRWNVYVFHFSDGEDWDCPRTVNEGKKLIFDKKINMLAYTEIHVDEQGYTSYQLIQEFAKVLPLDTAASKAEKLFVGGNDCPFIGSIIEDREDIWPTIKGILRKDRWQQ